MPVLCLLLAVAPAMGAPAGKTAAEIVLTAPRGDRAARAVLAAAAADLQRTPLHHAVRVAVVGGEEAASPGRPGHTLAILHVEGAGGSGGPVIHGLDARRQAPGWLVHAVLKGGQAVGRPVAVADRRFPLLGQLVVRSVEVRRRPAAEAFERNDAPAVILSDRSLLSPAGGPAVSRDLDGWARTLAGAVRRLDTLAARPPPEDQYLAWGGRVWLRRDLIWAGFVVWALLVFRGLPGRWRGGSSQEHGRQMRAYLPGFLFRALLLAAVLLAPVFAVLLLPAAILALLPPRPRWARILWMILGLLPLLAYLTALGWALRDRIASLEGGFQAGPAAVLIPAALLAWCCLIARGPLRSRALTVAEPPRRVEV